MKIIVALSLVIVFCIANSNSFSQATFVNQIVTTTHGYSFDNLVNAVNGDYFTTTGFYTDNSHTSNTVNITRVNKMGKMLWQKEFSLNYSNTYTLLSGTSDNGLLMFLRVNNPGKRQFALLIKCDSLGNKLWAKKLFGITSYLDITPEDVIEDSGGNYILLYDTYINDFDEVKIQVAKFSQNGELLSQFGYKNVYNTSQSQYFRSGSIIQTSNNDYLISFSYECSWCQNGPRTYIIDAKQTGELTSYRSVAPQGHSWWDNNAPIDFVKNKESIYLLGYYFDNSKYEPERNSGDYFYWSKLRKDGSTTTATIIPYNIFALQKFFRENNIIFLKSTNEISGAVFKKNSITILHIYPGGTSPTNSFLVTHYDSLGRTCPDFVMPQFPYDTSSRPFYTSNEIIGAEPYIDTLKVINADGTVSDVDVSYLVCSGVAPSPMANKILQNKTLNTTAKISPNPASNKAIISFTSDKIGTAQVSISGTDGKTLQTMKLNVWKGKNVQSINVASLAKGIYFVTILVDGKQTVLKFLKQ